MEKVRKDLFRVVFPKEQASQRCGASPLFKVMHELKFYGTQKWRKCRDAYMERVGHLCEDCLAHGILTPAEIVHHKIELTQENVDDPNIALSFDNLKAVCRSCHLKEHGRAKKRFSVDKNGNVTPL